MKSLWGLSAPRDHAYMKQGLELFEDKLPDADVACIHAA